MATEQMLDRGGLDGFDWDSQSVGLYAGGGLLGGSAGGASKRAGVIPAVGTPLKYILSSGLLGTVKAGVYAVPSPDASLGVHFLVLPTDFVMTHTTANGSQPRTDLIIVELSDVGSASSTAKVRLVTGTAGSGAPEPAMPSSLGNGAAYKLASVLINALATTLTSITDLRTFTVAAGGCVPVANVAAASTLPEGTPFYDESTDKLGIKTAAGTKVYRDDFGLAFGHFEGVPATNGVCTIVHSLGTGVRITVTPVDCGSPIDRLFEVVGLARDATTAQFQIKRTDATPHYAFWGNVAAFDWIAIA